MVYETQIYKEKLDKKKLELIDFKRKTEDLMKYKILYDSFKAKETEREKEKIENLAKNELKK